MPAGGVPPPPCISYADVHNNYGPYAYCSLDKGVAYTKGGGASSGLGMLSQWHHERAAHPSQCFGPAPFLPNPMGGQPTHRSTGGAVPPQKGDRYVPSGSTDGHTRSGFMAPPSPRVWLDFRFGWGGGGGQTPAPPPLQEFLQLGEPKLYNREHSFFFLTKLQ